MFLIIIIIIILIIIIIIIIIGVNICVADTISFMYMMKSNGPKIEPCGTPVVIFDIPDLLSSKSIYCFLFVKWNRHKPDLKIRFWCVCIP